MFVTQAIAISTVLVASPPQHQLSRRLLRFQFQPPENPDT